MTKSRLVCRLSLPRIHRTGEYPENSPDTQSIQTYILPVPLCKRYDSLARERQSLKASSACLTILSVEPILLICCRFVKDFSAADVILSYPVQCTSERSEGLDKYIHLKKWFDAIRERPAYKRAEEKGGKLELVK